MVAVQLFFSVQLSFLFLYDAPFGESNLLFPLWFFRAADSCCHFFTHYVKLVTLRMKQNLIQIKTQSLGGCKDEQEAILSVLNELIYSLLVVVCRDTKKEKRFCGSLDVSLVYTPHNTMAPTIMTLEILNNTKAIKV